MSRKFSAARRAVFLRAVAETGNQTLAAERAKVSRSWVTMTRAAEPDFDAAVRAAVQQAQDRLGRASGRPSTSLETSGHKSSGASSIKPPSGWGHLDGVELVVRGTNGRHTQMARARVKEWSPSVEARFLSVLAATCNVKASCAAVGLSATSAYNHRDRWHDFGERWDRAIEEGYERLETGLIEAGCNLFSDTEQPPDATVSSITAAEALHLLHMYKRRMTGIGKRVGRPYKVATNAEIIAALKKRLRQFGVKV